MDKVKKGKKGKKGKAGSKKKTKKPKKPGAGIVAAEWRNLSAEELELKKQDKMANILRVSPLCALDIPSFCRPPAT